MRCTPHLSLVFGAVFLLATVARPAAAQEPGSASALSITKVESADPVAAGTNLVYTITVTSSGPGPADNVSWSDVLPAGTTFSFLFAPDEWTCSTPVFGAGGTVSCSIASLGAGSVAFDLGVRVSSSGVAGSVLTNTANVTTTTADDPADNTATETTTVAVSADVQVGMVDLPDPVDAGFNALTYHINVHNAGPSDAATVVLSDTLPAGTYFQGISVPDGWTCVTPPFDTNGTVSCSIPLIPGGVGSVNFMLFVRVDPTTHHGSVLSNTAAVTTATPDPFPENSATVATVVTNLDSEVTITSTDTPDPVLAGGNITYTITATNNTSVSIESAAITEIMPAGTTFVSVTAPDGWICNLPPAGGTGNFECGRFGWPPGSAVFTLVLQVSPSTLPNASIHNGAHLSAQDRGEIIIFIGSSDTRVLAPASVSATKTVSGSFTPGSTVTYTVVLSNAGPSTQQNNLGREFIDVLPAGLTLVSATASSSVAAVNLATNTVTWDGQILPGSPVTITINATVSPAAIPGTTISNQGSFSYDADGNGTNEAPGVTDNPATAGSDATSFVVVGGQVPVPTNIPTLGEIGLALLVLLLAMGGALTLRKRRA